MPESDQEVFEHFRSDYGDSPREIGLLAYAGYAQEKYDWVNQRLSRTGKLPTDGEMAEWISDLPNSRLAQIQKGAVDTFKEAAETYMKARVEEERARAIDQSILGRIDAMAARVERATSFWRTIGPNVIVAVVGSFVFALIILATAAIYRGDPTPFALLKALLSDSTSAPPR